MFLLHQVLERSANFLADIAMASPDLNMIALAPRTRAELVHDLKTHENRLQEFAEFMSFALEKIECLETAGGEG